MSYTGYSLEGVLPLYRGAVCVFYSPSRLGYVNRIDIWVLRIDQSLHYFVKCCYIWRNWLVEYTSGNLFECFPVRLFLYLTDDKWNIERCLFKQTTRNTCRCQSNQPASNPAPSILSTTPFHTLATMTFLLLKKVAYLPLVLLVSFVKICMHWLMTEVTSNV